MKNNPETRDLCLILDGMAIRKHVIWDAKNGTQYTGYVDLGAGASQDESEIIPQNV